MPELHTGGHRIHYVEVGPHDAPPPALMFLHEGIGSAALWRSFPEMVAETVARRGIVYDRRGHGWSDPLTVPRNVDFMHNEARVGLVEVLSALGVSRPVLIGHSDGASISIIHAGEGHAVAALVLLAPHVFVESRTLEGVAAARERFETTDLAERMAKYHHDPIATFLGWADVWESPDFGTWDLTGFLPAITCPVLVIQGVDDEYGTPAQVEAIVEGVSGPVETVMIEACGHAPHLDQPDRVAEVTAGFLARVVT